MCYTTMEMRRVGSPGQLLVRTNRTVQRYRYAGEMLMYRRYGAVEVSDRSPALLLFFEFERSIDTIWLKN